MNHLNRTSGVLLHPTSFPSPWGIGDLGEQAFAFVDFLEAAGQHLWQVLPLSHTGFGDSPYQGFSAFAGQPLLISPAHLLTLSLITSDELSDCPPADPSHISYGEVIPWKTALLHKAHARFPSLLERDGSLRAQYERFCQEEAFWLSDYALFMACKDENGQKSWLDWPEDMRTPSEETKAALRLRLAESLSYYMFIQFFFFLEWRALKTYANEHGVRIIGDIPIFVSLDSADVWANQRLFQLDSRGFPLAVAGVPPDYFSATGQLWGNPLYRWEAHRAEHFSWWISRIQSQLKTVDILRIDHFRGFEAYWAVPYGETTAIHGEWIKAPGYELFHAVEEALSDQLPVIAEDLGVITDEVRALRDHFHFPGMKVLQFAFDSTGENDYLPYRFESPSCICYTGTHDNDTSNGWYATLGADAKEKLQTYAGTDSDTRISRELIRICLESRAAYAIFPLQDLLGIGSEGRMNTPGVAAGNWGWRYEDGVLTSALADRLRKLTRTFGR